MITHREAIKAFLDKIDIHDSYVIDWGSGSKPAMRYIHHLGCHFITVDKNKLIATDRRADRHVEHDIEKPINIIRADYAFCMEVLEHTTNPAAVIRNIWMNLDNGGRLYLSVPYDFRIHSDDDYLRYTPNGMKKLLNDGGFGVRSCEWTTEQFEGLLVEAVK